MNIDAIMQDVSNSVGIVFYPIEAEHPYSSMYIGEYKQNIMLKLGFETSFPYTLPALFVSPPPAKHLHISNEGKICLTDEASLLLDTSKPVQLIIECIKLAENVLNLSPNHPQYQKELEKEFLSYWGLQKQNFSIQSIVSIPNHQSIMEVPLFRSKNSYVLAPSLSDANCFICDYLGLPPIDAVKNNVQSAWVIRLKDSAHPLSPFDNYDWSSIIRYIKNNTDQEIRQKFWEMTSVPVKKKILWIIFVVPSICRKDGDVVFGIIVFFDSIHKLPIKVSLSKSVAQVNVIRHDYDFLLSRCGSTPSLKAKKVLLLGCGSIGGFLANNLCQMGITQLDLLDKDTFSINNVYRHFMGFEAIKQGNISYKADLLGEVLLKKYAFLDIDSLNYIDRSVEKVLLDNPDRMTQYDLIISALGEPTLNLAINDILVQNNINVPFIVCFNEPYGIGGHIITTNLGHDSCLRCFYSDLRDGSLCSFRGSLVEPGQNFKKTLSGCSGVFVPYSTLDSQQTAIYAARKAIDVLSKKLTHNDFYTWRGDSSLLKSQGFSVSKYFLSNDSIENFSNPCCPICQKRD